MPQQWGECERCGNAKQDVHYNNFLGIMLCDKCDEIAMDEDAMQDDD